MSAAWAIGRHRLALPLRWESSDHRCSTYIDAEGDEIFLLHGSGHVLCDIDDLPDVQQMWRKFELRHRYIHTDRLIKIMFREHVSSLLLYPDQFDEWRFCNDCRTPDHEDDGARDYADNFYCGPCSDNLSMCEHCECSVRWPEVVGDTYMCVSCRSDNYSYCEECSDWYHNEDSDEHTHDGSNCCESPLKEFSVPNGTEFLANDTRVTVTLPGGVISDEGMDQIASTIFNHGEVTFPYYDEHSNYIEENEAKRLVWRQLSRTVRAMDAKWQAKDGNFTKRVSRTAHKEHGLKVPPALVSEIGNIASAQSAAVNFDVEVTREFDLSAAEFGHAGSCYWQSYYAGRCVLKSNGGIGLRAFNEGGKVTGRAWIIPVKVRPHHNLGDHYAFSPTFDLENAVGYVVFNGYGVLSGYVAARVLSQMFGMTYRKVGFGAEDIYINAGGYLIGSEEVVKPYTDGSLHLNTDQHSSLFEAEQQEVIVKAAAERARMERIKAMLVKNTNVMADLGVTVVSATEALQDLNPHGEGSSLAALIAGTPVPAFTDPRGECGVAGPYPVGTVITHSQFGDCYIKQDPNAFGQSWLSDDGTDCWFYLSDSIIESNYYVRLPDAITNTSEENAHV